MGSTISSDSKSFSKKTNHFLNKKQFGQQVEAHEQKYGVYKMTTRLGITKGSSLNISWGKCGIWLVDQCIHTSLYACVCLIVDCTLRSLGIIILDAYLVVVFIWGIDMLIILIDHFAFSHILTLLVVWLHCSPWHVHSSYCLSRSSWHVWFLVVYYHGCYCACYPCQILILISLCVDLDDIYLFCMVVWCMTPLIPCDCMSCLSIWNTHLYVGHTLIPLFPSP